MKQIVQHHRKDYHGKQGGPRSFPDLPSSLRSNEEHVTLIANPVLRVPFHSGPLYRGGKKLGDSHLIGRRRHWLHFVGLRSQRCLRNSACNSPGSGPLSLAAAFASTFWIFRMPGMIVLTSGLCKINRSAISAIVEFAGIKGFSASACSTLRRRFSGTK